jgi:photosystem II stability/assembly factor-like uncharacterized protein
MFNRADKRVDSPTRQAPPITRVIALMASVVVILAARGVGSDSDAAERAQQRPPAVEHAHALAFDAAGQVLWLGGHAGLFRSEDAGQSWTKVGLPVKHDSVDVMAVTPDPRDASTVYIATHEAGVLKTTDGGRSWFEVNTGLRGHDVHGLAIDPNASDKLHALVRDKGEGVYRSTNGGRNWARVDDGPGGETKLLASVNLATGMGGIYLYAGTGEGLQRNPDCF